MFIGREKELKILKNQYDADKFEFTVLYGRRRIGKTYLIKQFIEERKAIYYMALESGANKNLELLSKSVYQARGLSDNLPPFQSYEALFSYITELAREERLILAIDEYPYLAASYPEIFSLIQYYCDHEWRDTKLQLILCGSSMSFMEKQVLGTKSPLYGRRTSQIKLKKFTFFETETYLKGMNREEIAIIHYICGGVAEYLTYIDKKKSLAENIINLFLSDTGRLYEEPENFLKQELREPRIYNDILDAIANGASKNNEIATKIGKQTGALNKYLNALIDLGIISKEQPINSKGRKTIYRLNDGSYRFWYRYVLPNTSAIELGLGKKVYQEIVAKDLNNFMGPGFEQIFFDYIDLMNQRGELDDLILQRGRWWGNNPKKKREEEIDMVGYGKKITFLAEVKWTKEPINIKIINDLFEKSELIEAKEKRYLFFSKNGFDDNVTNQFKNDKKIKLITFLK